MVWNSCGFHAVRDLFCPSRCNNAWIGHDEHFRGAEILCVPGRHMSGAHTEYKFRSDELSELGLVIMHGVSPENERLVLRGGVSNTTRIRGGRIRHLSHAILYKKYFVCS